MATDNRTHVLERRDGESPLQYHKRLIEGKLVDKTLADFDYSELSKYVYGKEYAPDVARRCMYGSRYTLDLLTQEARSELSQTQSSDMDAKILELRKERQRFFDQRREYNKLITDDSRLEHLYETLSKSAERIPSEVGNIFNNRVPEFDCTQNEAILVFSDWHYGLKADNVFNYYDTSVCKERVATVVERAKQRILLNQCSKLHIVVLGDIFHGAIHTSARVASDELVCDQLMQASEILAQAILSLSECVASTVVHITYGNHARTVQNKNDSMHRDNMERIVPWWLKERIAAEEGYISKLYGEDISLNIEIARDTGSEFLLMSSCGHDFCASHGDLDSVGSSPRLLPALLNQRYNKNIEYILLGDKHHRESFNELGVTAMICGSLCGTDQYANNKRLYSLPSQLLLIVNKECGVDAEYRIQCG